MIPVYFFGGGSRIWLLISLLTLSFSFIKYIIRNLFSFIPALSLARKERSLKTVIGADHIVERRDNLKALGKIKI